MLTGATQESVNCEQIILNILGKFGEHYRIFYTNSWVDFIRQVIFFTFPEQIKIRAPLHHLHSNWRNRGAHVVIRDRERRRDLGPVVGTTTTVR